MENFENVNKDSQKEVAMEYIKLHEEHTACLEKVNGIGEQIEIMRSSGSDQQFEGQFKTLEQEREEASAELNNIKAQMDSLSEQMTDETRDEFLTQKIDADGNTAMYGSDGVQKAI